LLKILEILLHYSLSNLNLEYDSHLATTLICNLNHPSFDKYFLKIRLQKIQDFAATMFLFCQNFLLLAQSIISLHRTNLQITPINSLLMLYPQAATLRQKLNKKKIFYIKQYLTTHILDWHRFYQNIDKIPKGCKPKWFNTY
ncbi:14422_t:CDS:1, partial [Gigaspora margarita]